MDNTLLLAKVIGPVLLLRGVSILISRQHFVEMVEGLQDEIKTVTFSFFPIALMMAGIAIAVTYRDTSSLAAIIFHIAAWGAIVKASVLIVAPSVVVQKARLLVKSGFLYVVFASCVLIGGYLTWFGYLQPL